LFVRTERVTPNNSETLRNIAIKATIQLVFIKEMYQITIPIAEARSARTAALFEIL